MIGSLLCDRLNKWKSGVDGILDLWQAAGALQRGSSARSVATSAESLEKGNIRCALRWASDGRYGNSLRTLGSRGVASAYDNVAARDDLIHRHPLNVALLAGKLDSRLAPWFCGAAAPLTALVKGSGAFRPIVVGETLRRLVSKVCCVSVRDSLPSLLLPHGQVGVGIRNGLEAAVHSLRTILATACGL